MTELRHHLHDDGSDVWLWPGMLVFGAGIAGAGVVIWMLWP